MAKKNFWIDVFGWCLLMPSVYKTIFVGRYLGSPYLEPINYVRYAGLYEKLSVTAKVWVIPIVGAIISPMFILIGMGIIFRQGWARILLIIVCALELLFVATLCVVTIIFRPGWVVKNINTVYFDEILWFVVIPLLCLYVFSRPNVKKLFV